MSHKLLTRRATLAGVGGAVALGTARPAQAETSLTVLCHEVNKTSATSGKGGDVLAAWRKANNCEVSWITLDVEATSDRLLREAALSQTTIDVAFQTYATTRALSLMEPLEPYLSAAPIPGAGADLSDFPQSLVKSLKYQSSQRGIPVRVSVLGLLYNEALFEERGVTSLPTTFEELVDVAHKMTYTRPNGTKVHGLLFSATSLLSDGLTAFARCFDGDYMTPDLKITANQSGTVKSLEALAQLYKDGVLPPEIVTNSQEDVAGWMQQGLAAMIALTYARIPSLNDPRSSRFPGRIKPALWPLSTTVADNGPYQPIVESWSMMMPRNSDPARKKLAWSFIVELSKTQSAVSMSLNGNGPARLSAYADPRLANLPYMEDIAVGLKHGHISIPPFPNEPKATDIFVEQAQLAILGRKPAQQAMDEAVVRVKPLV